ncbi:hypothetical protein BDZ91DRAFT_121739 [Kalaharituber pfeilii]|nr:hypothetical protein BDZ91DRAFT_121739 [Kalaharituber pfeilii]
MDPITAEQCQSDSAESHSQDHANNTASVTPNTPCQDKSSPSPQLPGSAVTFPLARVNLRPAEVPCRYFLAGFCARGDNCWYKHDTSDLKIKKVQLRTVLKSTLEPSDKEAISEQLLPKEFMLPGQGQEALKRWRDGQWGAKTVEARAHAAELAEASDKASSKRSKVKKDVERILAKQDKIGESARKVAEAKEKRKVILLGNALEGIESLLLRSFVNTTNNSEPGVSIPVSPEICPICSEFPKVFGLMSGCDHIFCLECIYEWRSMSKANKTCPICRVRSNYVVPSSVYPYSPGRKDRDERPADNPPSTGNKDVLVKATDSTDGHSCNAKDGENVAQQRTEDKTASNALRQKRGRNRKKKTAEKPDPNPAKTRIVSNYLAKMKTIPCKFFCNPALARSVNLDHGQDMSQSICWGSAVSTWRKIPYCRYGNFCHFSHPHPNKLDEEYIYDEWEIRKLGLKREKKSGRSRRLELVIPSLQPVSPIPLLPDVVESSW